MKYNAKYDRWVSKNGIIYRYDEQHDKLVVCNVNDNGKGYGKVFVGFKNNKQQMQYVHRIVYETLGITKKNNRKKYEHQRYYWKRYGHLVEVS